MRVGMLWTVAGLVVTGCLLPELQSETEGRHGAVGGAPGGATSKAASGAGNSIGGHEGGAAMSLGATLSGGGTSGEQIRENTATTGGTAESEGPNEAAPSGGGTSSKQSGENAAGSGGSAGCSGGTDGTDGESGSTAGASIAGAASTAGPGIGGAAGSSAVGDGAAVGKLDDPCSPNGAYACSEHSSAHQIVCSEGKWKVYRDCLPGSLCDTRLGTNAGSCLNIVQECQGRTAGARVCNGQNVEICGLDLVTVKTETTCTNQVCENGTCTGECEPGKRQCKANIPQKCSSAGQWQDQEQETCGGATPICTGSGICGVCKEGDKKCTGNNTPFECSSLGQWEQQETCSGATPICTGAGNCGVCSQGDKQCSGKALQTCTNLGAWESQSTCAQSEICSNGACSKCPGTGGPTMVGLALGYCIDSTEVTRKQYQTWLSSNPKTTGQISACSWNATFTPSGDWASAGTDRPNNPVAYVDWCDAYAYCQSVGKRLCGNVAGGPNPYDDLAVLSSQWYAACTSNGVNAYPYGNVNDNAKCNGNDTKKGGTVEVGTMLDCTSTVNGYTGIYDLCGNVWEWEDSCDSALPSAKCHLRGGGFELRNTEVKCAVDDKYGERGDAYDIFGFRCCAP